MANGLSSYPLGDGRRRCSANLFFPWACLIQIRSSGVSTGEGFALEVDGVSLPLADFREHQAVAIVRANQGYHFVALSWVPPPEEPEAFTVTAHQFKSIEQLRVEHPELAGVVMKYLNAERFVLCEQYLISFPDTLGTQVFGIYTIDKNELKRDPAHGVIVKQDFLVWRPGTSEPPTYYSGLGGRGDPRHLHITALCERFGEPHFGCKKLLNGKWTCADHWTRADEVDARFPSGSEIRVALDAALTNARAGSRPV
jgi:hypothetical protein